MARKLDFVLGEPLLGGTRRLWAVATVTAPYQVFAFYTDGDGCGFWHSDGGGIAHQMMGVAEFSMPRSKPAQRARLRHMLGE